MQNSLRYFAELRDPRVERTRRHLRTANQRENDVISIEATNSFTVCRATERLRDPCILSFALRRATPGYWHSCAPPINRKDSASYKIISQISQQIRVSSP
jgi:hypothetical protein